ncbi:MAG TPA: response regulator transcription factor [Daejeonella sp.]|nr:response regulator transcription factor [Daejeonella sp.]
MKILIVEDEAGLRKTILDYFTGEGNICETAENYQEAIEKVALYQYDCILLDLTLPDGNGLDVLRNLKKLAKDEGVLIISARHSLDDKLTGLDLGADDYLVKPFHLAELKARVTAIVRRKNFEGNIVIRFNEMQINQQSKEVSVLDQQVPLTRKEYDLLLYFLANKGKVISKNAIAEHLWGDGVDLVDNFDFIYTHIKNLRKKLIQAGAADYIHSLYGMGYKFSE